MIGVYPSAISYIESQRAVQEVDHCKEEAKIEQHRRQSQPQIKVEADVGGKTAPPDDEIDPSKVQWDDEITPDPGSIRIPVDKFTGEKLRDREFLDRPKDGIEYIRPGRCYDLNRVAKFKESRKQNLLFYSEMTLLPPARVFAG